MFFSKKRKRIIIFTALFLLFLGSFLFAQARELELNYPQIGNFSLTEDSVDLPAFIKYIFNLSIVLIGIIAFGGLVFSGFLYLTSSGDSAQIKKAKDGITASIIGILLLLGSYLVLEKINPELLKLEKEDLETIDIVSFDELKLPDDITGTWIELPVETRIVGVEGEEYGMFEEKRLERIKQNAKDTAEEAGLIATTSGNLASLADKCKCNHGAQSDNKCSVPECDGDCKTKEDDDGTEECIDTCKGKCCTSDPCCDVRNEINTEKAKNRESSNNLQSLKENLFNEKKDLEIETEKLKRTLEIMRDDCSLSLIVSRDNYISLKDYYEHNEEEAKEMRYWDEVKKLIPMSYADFYCAVGGSRLGYFPENIEILSQDEIATSLASYEKYLATASHEDTISCQKTIPFGEVIDEGLKIANKLLKKMFNQDDDIKKAGMIQLQSKLIEKIDKLHLLINDCLSSHCTPVCECGSNCNGCEASHCAGGNPCPMGEIDKLKDEITDIYKEIEERKNEIFKIVNITIPEYLNGDFKTLTIWTHNCIADPEEIESGWILTNCERATGSIGPDGKIIETTTSTQGGSSQIPALCKCSNIDECKKNFPTLKDKIVCSVIENCTEFNFFCCRAKLAE